VAARFCRHGARCGAGARAWRRHIDLRDEAFGRLRKHRRECFAQVSVRAVTAQFAQHPRHEIAAARHAACEFVYMRRGIGKHIGQCVRAAQSLMIGAAQMRPHARRRNPCGTLAL
jgi:hypothetical protein